MISKLRERAQGESGFTLVELLVVMLIIGLLAAIAIPAFFNQKDKATDSQAKVSARTAETAMETYATDNGGTYDATGGGADASVGALQAIEPTLNDADLAVPAADLSAKGYTVTVTSGTGNTFSIVRDTDGTTSLDCTPADPANPGGCPSTGHWG